MSGIALTAAPPAASDSPGLLRRLAGNRSAALGGVLLALVLGFAVVGPLLWPGDPWEMVAAPMLWPGEDMANPLGTDVMGRDLATGLVSGARVSLLIGLVATLIAATIGTLFGALGGFYGGRTDAVLMRVTELFQTVPTFVLAVVLVAVFRPSVTTAVLAIGIVSWPATARLVRAQFLVLRDREFVLAAETLGMSTPRLILTQILPNALPPVIAMSTLTIAHAIQTEAALSFLGLGDPNVMSWGTIIGGGREQLTEAWYVCGLPGIAIIVTVLAFNLLGEGLNDALNPHLQRR
ncbi:ABC transporter permease [Roseococcus pinisoli]|uniref:ABC transporter permease n=1 Tax=Roseococcus pinisoli TaxID=2835040 RepID=A0ABS5QES9_9PROT|nr:ABC transporter permease [Roseococcus pinisoli]MBS7811811.1 ABC transporter permease [Roseococcus pinisoli]